MAEFTSQKLTLKQQQQLSFLDFDPNMELLMNQFTNQNPSGLGFSIDNFFTQQVPEFPGNMADNLPGINFHVDEKNIVLNSSPPGNGRDLHQCKKRRAFQEMDSSSSGISSPQAFENGNKGKNSSRRGKRMINCEDEEEKPKGVVHVRARRGQATDSHSLAERVRRGKINERLKCLQDIVPGCRKTMGMAVMLDEIINYVRSLQNQVDFLSMKLTAASTLHDFNSDTDAMKALQRANELEVQKMQRVLRIGYEELASTQLGPLDFSSNSYPSLSYNLL